MKPNRDAVKFRSNMTGEDVAVGIKAKNFAHIMGILTDLYSDQELAVIREYATNGRDAQIEAGVDRALEVTLPTRFKLEYRIRDFGVGLNAESIRDVYASYGESTKRDSDEFNGMLGIGGKAALTYSDQFTVISTREQVTTTVMVTRTSGGASMRIVSERPDTEREQGTEIIVPCKQFNAFDTKARAFFRYWPAGSVLIDGQQPERFEGLRLSDDQYVVKGILQSLVVMGGVPYPVPDRDLDTGLMHGSKLVTFVPIGAVEFVPAREALMMTTKTKDALADILKQFKANVDQALQTEINKAPSPRAALRTKLTFEKELPATGSTYTYRGIDFPSAFRLDVTGKTADGADIRPEFVAVPRAYNRLTQHTSMKYVQVEAIPKAIFFEGYDRATFSANMRKKLDQYLSKNGRLPQHRYNWEENVERYMLIEGAIPATLKPFIDPARIFPWSEVEAEKLPAVSARTGHITGSFKMYVPGPTTYAVKKLANDIDRALPMYHYQGNEHEARRHAEFLRARNPQGCTVVCVPLNRLAKYERENPKSVTTQNAIDGMANDWTQRTPEPIRKALYASERGWLGDIKAVPAGVTDPALAEARKLAALNIDDAIKTRRLYEQVMGEVKLGVTLSNPLDPYKLFDRWEAARDPQHTALYMNAVYAARVATKP